MLPRGRRVVVWQALRWTGLERLTLSADGPGFILAGTILAVVEGQAAEARYRIGCDASWATRHAEMRVQQGETERLLVLESSAEGWAADGAPRPALAGCVDVDLGWSPSTNTLPIRRLRLGVGERSGIVRAAWVRFPDLAVEVLEQEYERLAERRYRYTSAGGAFTAELEVDEDGLVVDYGDAWKRQA